jgi:hypothetical protein
MQELIPEEPNVLCRLCEFPYLKVLSQLPLTRRFIWGISCRILQSTITGHHLITVGFGYLANKSLLRLVDQHFFSQGLSESLGQFPSLFAHRARRARCASRLVTNCNLSLKCNEKDRKAAQLYAAPKLLSKV